MWKDIVNALPADCFVTDNFREHHVGIQNPKERAEVLGHTNTVIDTTVTELAKEMKALNTRQERMHEQTEYTTKHAYPFITWNPLNDAVTSGTGTITFLAKEGEQPDPNEKRSIFLMNHLVRINPR